ncbi:MAG: hypothetical protein GKS06_10960 [Acidobacteria bacterium]|nr:hypothetical protein [Acidobacteriota bacterium]
MRLPTFTLVVLALVAAQPTAPTQLDAGTESRALAAHIEDTYPQFLEDYIHVFLGHITCQYAFIDENVLNALADDTLRAMTAKGAGLIREQHPEDVSELSDAAVHYAASMAVLTTMEMWSNSVTAGISPTYEAPSFDCAASVRDNQRR